MIFGAVATGDAFNTTESLTPNITDLLHFFVMSLSEPGQMWQSRNTQRIFTRTKSCRSVQSCSCGEENRCHGWKGLIAGDSAADRERWSSSQRDVSNFVPIA